MFFTYCSIQTLNQAKYIITVLLADNHGIAIKGIKLLLSNSEDIEIVGEANDGKEVLVLLKELKPNVLITDISMSEMSRIELTRRVKKEYPETHALVLSTYFDEEYILDSFEAGALGYLPQNANEEQLVSAMEQIANGNLYYTPSVAQTIGSSLITK